MIPRISKNQMSNRSGDRERGTRAPRWPARGADCTRRTQAGSAAGPQVDSRACGRTPAAARGAWLQSAVRADGRLTTIAVFITQWRKPPAPARSAPSPPPTKRRSPSSSAWLPRWKAASCRSTAARELPARRRAAAFCRARLEAVEAAGQGARRRAAQALDATHEAQPSSMPGSRERARRRRGGARRAGCRPTRRPAWAWRCATACSTAASACGRCWCWRRRRRSAGCTRPRCAPPGGRADPCLFADPRRHAVHGQRRAAPRQAHGARAVRRGAGDARRRRDAGPGVRGADARRQRRAAGAAGAPVRAARARGRAMPAWPAARRSTSPASACRSTSTRCATCTAARPARCCRPAC